MKSGLHREKVESVFGCPAVNQYGANEFNSIALECPCGNMHVLTSNIYLEVLRDGKPIPKVSFISLRLQKRHVPHPLPPRRHGIYFQHEVRKIRQESVSSFQITFCVEEDVGEDFLEELRELFLDSISDRELRRCVYTFEFYQGLFPDDSMCDRSVESGQVKFTYFKRCFDDNASNHREIEPL